ncbi:hypothetical protein [Lacticaseibacillus nasuensis]|uniref:hypothetical protein n=1 Tax=Lacticaseibacillus nasuensis TaxID=944671 RepID=UPI0022456953|nr:hypothetical protein [Lacticaseibacillus nasuensis]MCX2456014.1 hypothetical protein [Lacticaseibacillus nasuensis]
MLFPNQQNYITQNGFFHVYGHLRANARSNEYKMEFRSRRNKMMVLVHSINIPDGDLYKIPHIFVNESNASKRIVSLCLYRNKVGMPEFIFGDDLQQTIIPWAQEWIYFYELYLITGKWYGNGEHPQEPKNNS